MALVDKESKAKAVKDAPATLECPDETICRNCGGYIGWDDWSYIHDGGDMDCVRNNRQTSAEPIEWDRRVRGRWWAEDSEDSWDLYYAGTDDPDAVVHGLKVLKAPKHSTPYAEYWPDVVDGDYIVAALNAFGKDDLP